MGISKPLVDGGSATASGLSYTALSLSAAAIVQDPQSAVNAGSTTYGVATDLAVNNVDPGNINGTPDCLLFHWLIDSSFDYVDNSSVLLRMKLTGTPTSNYLLYLGLYDGTVASNHGLFGSIQTNNGATGAQTMGAQSTFGQASASIQANGGSLNVAFNLDNTSSPTRPRGNLVRSQSATGPAHGRTERTDNPTSWAATSNLYAFLAVGGTGVRDAGTFAGLEVGYLVIPRFT